MEAYQPHSARIRLLRGERNREFVLNFEQEKLYRAAASDDLRDVGTLLVDTGLRIGEALSLEWPEVHTKAAPGATYGYVKVRAGKAKNSKSRNVPITGRAREMFQRRKPSKAGYVFHRADGQPLYQTWINQQHSELRTLLKMPADFVPHSVRHTFGTRLGESGADAFTIMKLMGHSSVTVSQKYVHPSPESDGARRGASRSSQQIRASGCPGPHNFHHSGNYGKRQNRSK